MEEWFKVRIFAACRADSLTTFVKRLGKIQTTKANGHVGSKRGKATASRSVNSVAQLQNIRQAGGVGLMASPLSVQFSRL